MQRRTFLKSSLVASLTSPLLRLSAAAESDPALEKYRRTIGLQLYTLRNQMAEDERGTLQAVADAGYQQVEMMDAVTGGSIAKTARELGLDVTSAFLNFATIVSPESDAPSEDDTLKAAEALGLEHLVFGYVDHDHRKTADQYKMWAGRANDFGRRCKAAGVQLCYHNHSFEFEPLPVGPTEEKGGQGQSGECGFEILIRELDADLVPFELDVFWAQLGGYDPVRTIGRLKGRLSQVHLKDLRADTPTIYDNSRVPATAFEELGDGIVDLRACMWAADEAGAVQCHVEQDQSPDPVASVRKSMAWLSTAD